MKHMTSHFSHRKFFSLLSLTLVLALLGTILAGCSGSNQATPSPQSSAVETAPTAVSTTGANESYKIGGLFAVTGNNSPLGTPERDTALMLQDQINANGGINGHPIQVIAYDTESDVTKCVTLAKKLIEQDKVLAIIGPSSTAESLAVAEIAEKAEVPLISCAAAETIVQPVKKWIFKTAQNDSLAVDQIFEYLKGQGISKIAIITSSSSYGTTGKAAIEAAAPNAGISIVDAETFADTDLDMTAQLTRIKGTDAQAVLCWGTNPGPAIIAKNMRQLNMSIPLLQSHGVSDQTFITLAGDAANGVIFPAGAILIYQTLLDSHPQKAILTSYAEAFQSKFGKAADHFGGHSYDALMLIAKALEKAGPDKAKIRDEIEQTTGFVGIAGTFNMSATDHGGLSKDAFVMIKIVDGQWTLAQ